MSGVPKAQDDILEERRQTPVYIGQLHLDGIPSIQFYSNSRKIKTRLID
jgi:hypothetical protein